MDYDLSLIFPNTLKIGLNDANFNDYTNISLSLTSDVVASFNQEVSNIPISKRYKIFNGVTKGLKQFSVAGIVSDDILWGQMVQTFGTFNSFREYIASNLEVFYDDETLLTFWDSQLGYRKNLIITSLEQRPSSEYTNSTEWNITFTQVKFVDYTDNNNSVTKSETIDPYRFYLFN